MAKYGYSDLNVCHFKKKQLTTFLFSRDKSLLQVLDLRTWAYLCPWA